MPLVTLPRRRRFPLKTRSQLAGRGHLDGGGGGAALATDGLHLLDHVHALGHLAEDAVLAVEEVRLGRTDEELAAVGVGARVGHRQRAGRAVADVEVLVLELTAVDALAAHAVTRGDVAALAHEAGDDAVEGASTA